MVIDRLDFQYLRMSESRLELAVRWRETCGMHDRRFKHISYHYIEAYGTDTFMR